MTKQEDAVIREMSDEDFEIVHDPNIPALYVDGAQGFAVVNGVARINLYQFVQVLGPTSKDSYVKKVVNGHLTMSPAVALAIGQVLVDRAKESAERLGE